MNTGFSLCASLHLRVSVQAIADLEKGWQIDPNADYIRRLQELIVQQAAAS
jgi:hypothetical protein